MSAHNDNHPDTVKRVIALSNRFVSSEHRTAFDQEMLKLIAEERQATSEKIFSRFHSANKKRAGARD